MQEEKILQRAIEGIGLTGLEIWKAKRSNSPEITSYEVISAVLREDSIPKAASTLGIGYQTLNRIIAKSLVPILGSATGGNNTWKLKLLKAAKIKKCKVCSLLKDHIDFTSYVNTFDGLDPVCKLCKTDKNNLYYKNNKDTYHKQYIEEHRKDYVARNAERRARKLLATPIWADTAKIKEIYKSCPTGYHVDHIVPLVNPIVCGLHVENNLQIIAAEENLRKSNKFSGDW